MFEGEASVVYTLAPSTSATDPPVPSTSVTDPPVPSTSATDPLASSKELLIH